MININFFGNTSELLEDTFGDIDVQSFSSTGIVVRDQTSGFVTTVNGTGFVQDASAESGFRGTVNGFSTVTGTGAKVITLTGLSVQADTFDAAIAAGAEGNNALLSAMLSTDNVTVDASMSNTGIDLRGFFDGVTSNITITGSNFFDWLQGAAGNDRITIPNQPDNGDLVIGTNGNDTINLSAMSPDQWIDLAYFDSNAVTVTVNGAANTAQVVKAGQGTDTILGVQAALQTQNGGITFQGSNNADNFVVDGGPNSWMQVFGRGGNDNYNITLSGVVRVSFDYSNGGLATQGAVVNVATGRVANDGLGGTDQISLTNGAGILEISGTNFNDNITGSGRNERFILQGGNDTLDAGGGIDRLRFDRNQVDGGVTVDLGAGTATGVWNGQAFNHTISGIEEVRGTRNGSDHLTGSMGDDTLRGYGGDDSLFGGEGSDFLSGGDGNDYLNPGDNTSYDEVNAHSGNDTVDLGDIVNGYVDVQHYDLAYAAGQVITLDGRANTGTINKGVNGTTTILDIKNAMQADGLGVLASNQNDTINVTVAEDGFVQVAGGRGNDSFVLDSLGGLIRIDLRSDAQYQYATQGAVVDLGAGIISNDGFGFQDTINRTSTGRIEVRGTDFADNLLGGGLRDSFIGRGGNDTIDGGDGIDRVRYDRGDMTSGVKVDLEKGVATGMWEGAAFTHTLSNIEEVRASYFGDSLSGTLGAEEFDIKSGDDFVYGDGIQANLTGDVAGQVYRMYQATLDRAPDAAGYKGWVTNLYEGSQSVTNLPNGFVNSGEFKKTYGALDDSGFVNLLYQNVLGRAADAGELQGWMDAMAAGTTRAGVVLGFSESREFKRTTAQDSAEFALSQSESHWTDDIYRVYRATLDRDPDAAGFAGWAEMLGSGTTYGTMVNGFVDSREFKNTYGALDDTGFVELLYQNVLDRAADAGGLQGWLDFLSGGGTRAGVVEGFAQSGEFQRGTAADLTNWVRGQGTHDEILVGEGTNVLMGGVLSDRFEFRTGGGNTTIVDFEDWDELDMRDFGYDSFATFQSHLSQSGDDLVFADQGTTFTLNGLQLNEVTAAHVDLF